MPPYRKESAAEAGADGIGLFRSEFLYLGRGDLPGEEEQLAAYRRALSAFPHGQVIVRTLDIGADKTLASVPASHEENPALGVRGVRFCFRKTAPYLMMNLSELNHQYVVDHCDAVICRIAWHFRNSRVSRHFIPSFVLNQIHRRTQDVIKVCLKPIP